MTYWTPARDEKLKQLWPNRELTVSMIAAELAMDSAVDSRVLSGASISFRAKYLSLPPRNIRRNISASSPSVGYMTQEAAKRGITVTELVRRVMATVQKDKLVGAILDDEHSIAPVIPATVS